MTPLQFAVAECANHQPDGSCAGVMINRDLSMSRASPLPRWSRATASLPR